MGRQRDMFIQSGDLGREIAKVLEDYQFATYETVKKSVDKVAKEAVGELKSKSPRAKNGGAYAASWTSKVDRSHMKSAAYAKYVYNEKHYRLAHLLEKGHKVPQAITGKRWVDAREHIRPIEEKACENLVKYIKEGV